MPCHSSRFSVSFRGISRLGSPSFHLFAMIQTCTYLYSSKYSPQGGKQGIDRQIFNKNSIWIIFQDWGCVNLREKIDFLLKFVDRFLAYPPCQWLELVLWSFSIMRSFCYYYCLSLIRTHFCFSFENDLSYERSKR